MAAIISIFHWGSYVTRPAKKGMGSMNTFHRTPKTDNKNNQLTHLLPLKT